MDQFFKMDVFFVVATIGFVVLAILLAIALFYVIQLLHTLNDIATTVGDEATALKADLDSARASISRGGVGLLSLFGFAGKTGARLLTKNKKRKSS
jgi:hypothetical protein